MKEVKVSIIVPIYNTVKYLDQCIRSAVEQTWQNIEILLLDDGSTDGSLEACMRWAGVDGRIRLFKEGHLGQGAQRNIGIRESKGDYILFLDSDDYLEPNAVKTVVTYIVQKNAQICFFSYWHEGAGSEGMEEATYRINNPIKLQGCTSICETPEILGFYSALLWDKCFEGSFLRGCGLTMRNLMCEDLLFLGQLFEKADRICTLDACLYHYRSAREGNFREAYNRFYDVIEVIDGLNQYYKKNGNWNVYWKQLYRISNTVCKDIIDRTRLRGKIGNSEEKERFIGELKTCLKSWYGSRIDIEFYDNRFIIMGSKAVRDIVMCACSDGPAWFRDYTGSSILKVPEIIEKEPFGVDYVIVDFLEEDFAEVGLDMDISILGECLIKVFERIKVLNADSSIKWMIIKNYYCETYGVYWDNVRTYQDIRRIREMNHRLGVLYEYIKARIPEAMFVETDFYVKWRYSDLKQWGGSTPKAYNTVYIGTVSTGMSVMLYQEYGMTKKGIKEQIMHAQPGSAEERLTKGFSLLCYFYQCTGTDGKSFSYFIDNGLNRIAIYGMGILGQALCREAEHAGVEVAYVIDRKHKEIDGLLVYQPEQGDFPDTDAIVVTPVQDYWNIVRQLEKKTSIPIVSLEDVVAYEQK